MLCVLRRISHGALQVNLKEQGQLIRQDEFMVTFRKKKCFRHIFLFQELVLFSKTRKTDVGNDTYIYKQSFKVLPHTRTHTRPRQRDYQQTQSVWCRLNKSKLCEATDCCFCVATPLLIRSLKNVTAASSSSFICCFKTKAAFPFRLSVPHLFIHLLQTDFSGNAASMIAWCWTASDTSSTWLLFEHPRSLSSSSAGF